MGRAHFSRLHASSELWAGPTFLGCMRRVSCGPGPLSRATSELWAGSTFLGCMRRVSCGPISNAVGRCSIRFHLGRRHVDRLTYKEESAAPLAALTTIVTTLTAFVAPTVGQALSRAVGFELACVWLPLGSFSVAALVGGILRHRYPDPPRQPLSWGGNDHDKVMAKVSGSGFGGRGLLAASRASWLSAWGSPIGTEECARRDQVRAGTLATTQQVGRVAAPAEGSLPSPGADLPPPEDDLPSPRDDLRSSRSPSSPGDELRGDRLERVRLSQKLLSV